MGKDRTQPITVTQCMIRKIVEPIWGKSRHHTFDHDNSRPDMGFFSAFIDLKDQEWEIDDPDTYLCVGIIENGMLELGLVGCGFLNDLVTTKNWKWSLSNPNSLEECQVTLGSIAGLIASTKRFQRRIR